MSHTRLFDSRCVARQCSDSGAPFRATVTNETPTDKSRQKKRRSERKAWSIDSKTTEQSEPFAAMMFTVKEAKSGVTDAASVGRTV